MCIDGSAMCGHNKCRKTIYSIRIHVFLYTLPVSSHFGIIRQVVSVNDGESWALLVVRTRLYPVLESRSLYR